MNSIDFHSVMLNEANNLCNGNACDSTCCTLSSGSEMCCNPGNICYNGGCSPGNPPLIIDTVCAVIAAVSFLYWLGKILYHSERMEMVNKDDPNKMYLRVTCWHYLPIDLDAVDLFSMRESESISLIERMKRFLNKTGDLFKHDSIFTIMLFSNIYFAIFNYEQFNNTTPLVLDGVNLYMLIISCVTVGFKFLIACKSSDLEINQWIIGFFNHMFQGVYIYVFCLCYTGPHAAMIEDDQHATATDDYELNNFGHFNCTPTFLAVNGAKLFYHLFSLSFLLFMECRTCFKQSKRALHKLTCRICCSFASSEEDEDNDAKNDGKSYEMIESGKSDRGKRTAKREEIVL